MSKQNIILFMLGKIQIRLCVMLSGLDTESVSFINFFLHYLKSFFGISSKFYCVNGNIEKYTC